MKIKKIDFGAGESRFSKLGGDYISIVIEDEDEDEIELYAEDTDITYYDDDGNLLPGHSEWEDFQGLVEEIIEQAKSHGLDVDAVLSAMREADIPTTPEDCN